MIGKNVPIKFAKTNSQFEGMLGDLFRQINLVGSEMEKADKNAVTELKLTLTRKPLKI